MPIRSPFPSMDPWLERHWGDIHQSVITYVRDQLQPMLPPGLRARTQERVFLETPDGPLRVSYPDIRVVERSPDRGGGTAVATIDAAAPVEIQVGEEPITEGYVEIVEAGTRQRVVTVIEILSRKNKVPGEGQNLYLRKQQDCREARVNLVEIDLLRAGQRILLVPQRSMPSTLRTLYQICVWRGVRPTVASIYAVSLQMRLPVVHVPLRPDDADVQLDLQALIEQAYRNGGYDDIDYKSDPEPPLDPSNAAWADQLLRERGLR